MKNKIIKSLIGLPLYYTLGYALFNLLSGKKFFKTVADNLLVFTLCFIALFIIQLLIFRFRKKPV